MKRNRMVSMILVFMMVLSAMFGGMTVFSFAEGEQSNPSSGTAEDTIGPALQDYTIEISNADPKTEADQTFIVTLIFNENLTTDRWTKSAFNIYLNDTLLAQTKYQLNSVTAEGNKLILNISGNNDEFVAIYRGVLKISLRSNYYEDIMDESGNACSYWTDIKTLIPVGIAFEQDASKTVLGDASTPASVTFKVTGEALLRGMSPIQITVGGESIVTSDDATVAVHTHNFIEGTNENWASNLAGNFNKTSTGKYTMTASGDTVTLTANENGADEALANSTVIQPYAFVKGDEAAGTVNDAVVQPTLLALAIKQAEERLDAIDPSLVTVSAKEQLQEALEAAEKVAEKDAAEITSPLEWNEARSKLEAGLEAASDNAIVTDSARRHNGSVSFSLHGGSEWVEAINGVSVDGNALTADQFTVDKEKKSITIKSTALDTAGQITPRLKDYNFSVSSNAFATVEKTIRIEYRGSNTFQVRYIDEEGNVLVANTYSREEMIAMSSEESEWYNSSCTVMGPDTFLAKGVHVQDLLDKLLASDGAQGITFNPDTTVIKIRTNDSLKYDADADPETVVNDSTTQNGYFNTISYNDLMRDRYYFPGLYNGSGIGDNFLNSKRFQTTEREDVGSDPDKTLCEPMIAWEYVERFYGDDQTKPTEDDYNENVTADMGFRFLLGSPIKISPNGKPMVDDNYWTQFLVAFQCFGIDFVCESAKVTFNTTPEDANIELTDISGKVLARNEDGTFSAPQTPSQPYTYTVSKDGYTEQTGTFTVNEKAVSTGVNVEVTLEIKEGWIKTSTGWWYQYADGTYPKNEWQKIDGKWYHFNENGYMQTGWLKDQGEWYYLKSSGAMAASGWLQIDSTWYYFNDSGAMAHDTWKGDYYLTSSGAMATDTWIDDKYYVGADGKWVEGKVKEGWIKTSTGWWYQYSDGSYPKNEWQKIDGKWYHFDAKGYMQTGWLKDQGEWYYLKSDGAMTTGWLQIDSTWYYFYNNGAMAHDTWKGNYYLTSSGAMATNTWIDDKYYVGENGEWVKDKVKE